MPRPKRKELADFIKTLQGAPVPENETAVEYKVAGPVLELLGWDVYSNLQWRRQIGSRRTAGVVDVALLDEEGARRRSSKPKPLMSLWISTWISC